MRLVAVHLDTARRRAVAFEPAVAQAIAKGGADAPDAPAAGFN
jgi:hypothetical protein